MTNKKLFFFLLTSSLTLSSTAQNWTWAETAGGILPDEANGCAIDQNGNMYMTGFFFSNSINFNSGNSMSNSGICEGFVVKYNVSGSSAWASRIKGSGEDKATKCAVDNTGNIIATGYFNSPSLQFGGNNAHSISNFDNSGNTFDCFVVKYNSSGTPQWFRAIGKADDDGGRSVATDSSGNVYVTGWFRAPSIVVGNVTLYNKNSSGGSSDMFLIKYDPNGNVLWAKSAGSADDEKGNGCIVDATGNVVVTGYFKGDSIDIEGTKYPNRGNKDGFVIKYSTTGTLLAVKVFGGSSSEEPFACSTDGAGNIFVAGSFASNSVVFDADTIVNTGGNSDIFLVKLDTSLNTIWTKNTGSNSADEARGCATDKYGNTVITGVYTGSSITFGNTVLNNNGGEEIFLVKYAPDGTLLWAKKIGKSKDDGANDCAINNNGRIVIAGYYNSSSLTLGSINLNNSYVGVATSDVFIANTCNTSKGTDTRSACNSFTWIDGNTYTSNNNTAVYTLPSSAGNGCDSIVTLNLTINTNATGTDTRTACNAFTWIDGNTYTASNNSALYTIPNGATNGCDSIVTLHLTINTTAYGTDVRSACNSYTWIDGNTYTASNNTVTYTIQSGSVFGCDSVVTLNLTIDTVDVSTTVTGFDVTANASGATYQWFDCNNNFALIQGETAQTFSPVATGSYAVEVTRNSCTDTSTCVQIIMTGVSPTEEIGTVFIYPNPNSGKVNFDFGELKNVTVFVRNVNGQLLYTIENIQSKICQVDIKEGSGVYFAEVVSSKVFYRYRMIVQ
ncbi:MAG: T9SS type A sorting domain-containing protein [Chitinophagales bacterium]|nr:T9SS type A sorting domain-containing protein [Chitinophagales bacterium]